MSRQLLNQRWFIVNWKIGNTFQWNLNQNTNICVQENGSENVVCEILPRPWCIYSLCGAYMRYQTRLSLVQIITLSPIRHHAIVWTNAGLFAIESMRTHFSAIWIKVLQYPLTKVNAKYCLHSGVYFCKHVYRYSLNIHMWCSSPQNHSVSKNMSIKNTAHGTIYRVQINITVVLNALYIKLCYYISYIYIYIYTHMYKAITNID